MFKYSNTNKRYHTLDYYNKQKYNCKVAKLSIDVGYSCINRDGIKATGGCSFCPGHAISGFVQQVDLVAQIEKQKAIAQRKWPNCKYQLYWQSFSNTYASFERNKSNYKIHKQIDDVISLAIATRVDSISDKTLLYLDELSKSIDVTIEIGLQSMHDKTRKLLNCQYSLDDFITCVKRIEKTNCSIVVHIINGLPNETETMMLDTVKFLNQLKISGIKVHMLHIDKTTKLAKQYLSEPFSLFSMDQYTDIAIEQLKQLRQEIVIHRLTGDGIKQQLLAPMWTLNKTAVLNMIDKKMQERNIYQGDNA